ncbi:nucleotidyltransferase family protein [bacterium]|nr:nucleotidyltransferase family protein [bacterium]
MANTSTDPGPRSVAAIVLAAGGSRRLGQPKQLVRLAGHSLVFRATYAAVAAGCRPVAVVVGAVADEVVREIDSLRDADVHPVECGDWREGLSASLRCGLRGLEALPDVRADAVVILPCDQPALEPGVIGRLIDAWDGSPDGRVGCGYAGTIGSPGLFGRSLFPDLARLEGDRGAKTLLEGARAIAWPEGARDIDTPEDL